MDESGKPLTEQELDILLGQAAKATGGQLDEQDALLITRWAEDTRIRVSVLNLVLKQHLVIKVINGEINFQIGPELARRISEQEDRKTIEDIEAVLRKPN